MNSPVRTRLRKHVAALFADAAQSYLPTVVYHYTSLPAFLGILTSRAIWCSSVAFANDPAEVTYGDELIRRSIRSRLPSRVAKLLDTIQVDYYAASFSAAHDDLAQWRAYCNNGRGVAIGFRAKRFATGRIDAFFDDFVFARAIYDPERQHQAVESIMAAYAKAIGSDVTGQVKELLLIDLSIYLAVLRGVFKAPAYAAEREWRFVSATTIRSPRHHAQVRFRATPTAIIPYMSLQLSKNRPLPVESVVIGPCLDSRQTELSIRAFLTQTGHTGTQLVRSAVQMRP